MWCHSLGLQGTGRDLLVTKAEHSSGHLQVVAIVVADGSRSPVPVRVALPHALNDSLDEGLALLLQVLEQSLRVIVVRADLVPVLDTLDGINGALDGVADGLAVLRIADLRAGGALRHRAGLDASGEGDNGNWEETHVGDWKR